MLACSQHGALEERRTKSTHEMFPAPPRVPRGMLTLILFLLILFLTRAKDFVKKQGLLVVYPNLGIEKKIDIMFYVMERC